MQISPSHRTKLRKLCGISLRELANRIGVGKTRLNEWERNETQLHTSELYTLRNVLLELSGHNRSEVRRLLSRTPARRGELRPRTVAAVSRDQRAELARGEN